MTKKILTQTNTYEEEIKKSLFIGVCFPTNSVDDFFEQLNLHLDLNATHNCWAYRIGNEYRFNDDGEPSGTAGKPMLTAIDGADFDFVGALVIRHYGGIKLGTGGLARAYSGVITKNLQVAGFENYVPKVSAMVSLDFQYGQLLHQLLKQFDGLLLQHDYNSSGLMSLIEIPKCNLEPFAEKLNNYSKGTSKIKT
ncbi:MAG: YigZ family protein [Marinicella sp.]|nr:YigZ family protein [Xanthomonadales bacterium]